MTTSSILIQLLPVTTATTAKHITMITANIYITMTTVSESTIASLEPILCKVGTSLWLHANNEPHAHLPFVLQRQSLTKVGAGGVSIANSNMFILK